MIKLQNISKKLGDFTLNNISFSLDKGEYFVLLGKSGAGKTVLLEIISGLIAQDSGKIFLGENDISNLKIQKRNIGLVFQNHSLFPHINVKKNILYPLKAKKLNCADYQNKFEKLVKKLKIEHLLHNKPGTLSIGESQRVALARTLITSPQCILLDEPLSSLDTQAKTEIKSLLRKINRVKQINEESTAKTTQTIIHVTHDYEEAISLATKVAVIENGTISQFGTPEEIFRHPKTTFIANFIGIKNFYRGEMKIKNDSAVFTPEVNGQKSDLKIYASSYSETGFGSLILRSEDITISNDKNKTSARNVLKGEIIDIENVRAGIEITADIKNLKISALITRSSFDSLKLDYNKKVYLSFKASAVRFIKG